MLRIADNRSVILEAWVEMKGQVIFVSTQINLESVQHHTFIWYNHWSKNQHDLKFISLFFKIATPAFYFILLLPPYLSGSLISLPCIFSWSPGLSTIFLSSHSCSDKHKEMDKCVNLQTNQTYLQIDSFFSGVQNKLTMFVRLCSTVVAQCSLLSGCPWSLVCSWWFSAFIYAVHYHQVSCSTVTSALNTLVW